MTFFPQATILFAGLLTPIYIFLTVQVVMSRRKVQIAVGHGEHPDLLRVTRAHGNFAEYTPLFLILMYLQESYASNLWASYLLGGLFFAGRLAHAYAIMVHEPRAVLQGRSIAYMLRFRTYGMVHTFFVLGILALMLLFQYVLFVMK